MVSLPNANGMHLVPASDAIDSFLNSQKIDHVYSPTRVGGKASAGDREEWRSWAGRQECPSVRLRRQKWVERGDGSGASRHRYNVARTGPLIQMGGVLPSIGGGFPCAANVSGMWQWLLLRPEYW